MNEAVHAENRLRIVRARQTLISHSSGAGQDDLIDLLTDLHHLASATRLDITAAFTTARRHFEREQRIANN